MSLLPSAVRDSYDEEIQSLQERHCAEVNCVCVCVYVCVCVCVCVCVEGACYK